MAQSQKFLVEEYPLWLPLEGALVTVFEQEKYTGNIVRKIGAAYTGPSGTCIVGALHLTKPENQYKAVITKEGFPIPASILFQIQPLIKQFFFVEEPVVYEKLLPSGEYYILLAEGPNYFKYTGDRFPGKSAVEIAAMRGYPKVTKIRSCEQLNLTKENISSWDGFTNKKLCSCWAQTIPSGAYPAYAIYCAKEEGPISEPEGVIIACNINHLPCPNCGAKEAGQEIEVMAGMKNKGDAEGGFRFYIYDHDGNELSKEPDMTYKNIKPGETWGIEKTLLTNLNFTMPDKTLNGQIKLVRQT